MHSIFRIIAEDPKHKHILKNLKNDLNDIQEDLFEDMIKYDAISATILIEGCWEDHYNKIETFILNFSELLGRYRNSGLNYHIDVCVADYDDIGENLITSFVCEVDWLKILVDNHISLEFSYHNTQ
ncbi:MAG: hypothetical protein ACYTET_04660 [Planctomycetota bacterium]